MDRTRLPFDRRRFLGATIGALASAPAWADPVVDLGLPGGVGERPITTAFPEKGPMILQRTRPPLLETPWDVFDRGVFTPNDQFFVRWHWAVIPEQIDVANYRVAVRGHVNTPLSLSLADILALPRFEIAAVNQCSGNSRGLFQPRVAGGQWGNGAMGNAKWTGVRLRDVLDRAGIKPGALQVRFNGLDEPVMEGAPDFMKSLDVDHARDGEVMLAYLMNGEQLPLVNGFPLRLVVPGWYSTYWVKMLSDIEVLDVADEQYWMKTAYRIPDTPGASVKPGQTGFKTVPINAMAPRAWFTSLDGRSTMSLGTARPGATVAVRGIAMGGDCGVARVELSADAGRTWLGTALGRDEGPYSFRQWTGRVTAPTSDALMLLARCTNTKGAAQPMEPVWNGGGYMQNVVDGVRLALA